MSASQTPAVILSLGAVLRVASAIASFPTPPHSGYHLSGRASGFEGWYHRLTVDDASLSFIYSIFDAADETSPRHGCHMQVCGPDGAVTWQEGPAASFWADDRKLALGKSFRGVAFSKMASPAAFGRFVQDGFQLSSTRHQGVLRDGSARWSYEVAPQADGLCPSTSQMNAGLILSAMAW